MPVTVTSNMIQNDRHCAINMENHITKIIVACAVNYCQFNAYKRRRINLDRQLSSLNSECRPITIRLMIRKK